MLTLSVISECQSFCVKKKKPTKKNYDEIIKFSRENFISQTDKPVTASKPVIRCNNTKF